MLADDWALVMDFTGQMQACLGGKNPDLIGVAVSGGSDSTALLLMLAGWCKENNVTLKAATVDHGLRPEAAGEALKVANLCAQLAISHDILRWTGWDQKGNLQDHARQARRELLTDWANQNDIGVVALGHTMDDQAETVLMRLMRGSGVDGLAGMTRTRIMGGLCWIRPLLGHKRADLRAGLQAQGIDWVEDPSNLDDRYDRIRMRKLIAGMGLSVEGLAQTADRLQDARQALELETLRAARKLATVTDAGDVELDFAAFFGLPPEIRHRLAAHCVKWVTTGLYRPRFAGLRNWLAKLEQGQKRTLAGCVGERAAHGGLRLSREYAAVEALRCEPGAIWDGRWRLKTEMPMPDCTIAALGPNGLGQCADWRETGLARNSLLASPAIWQNGTLIGAPLAGWPEGWHCTLAKSREDFFSSVLSH